MKYRRLGKSGLQLSELSFGSWLTFAGHMDNDTAHRCMALAYDRGVNFFDNAEGYAMGESESVMGAALAKFDWPRETYVVSTKVFWGPHGVNNVGLCRKHVFEACHGALRRMKLDYLDLYYCHRADPDTPIEETVAAMHQLVTAGKVLYWGTSEWSAQEITEAYAVARQHGMTPPTMEQPQYNLLCRDRFEKEYARLYDPAGIGLGTTIFSPLAAGMLTGKYNNGIPEDSRLAKVDWLRENLTPQKLETIKRLGQIADELSLPMPVFAVAWCLKNPHVSSAILGASKPEQLEQTLAASDAVDKLTDNVMQRIDLALQPA